MQPTPTVQAVPERTDHKAGEHYCLDLYVAGSTPKSIRAIARTHLFCDRFLARRHRLRVIDIYQDPAAAGAAGIIAVPTLVRTQPLPAGRVIGDMNDVERIMLPTEIASTKQPGCPE